MELEKGLVDLSQKAAAVSKDAKDAREAADRADRARAALDDVVMKVKAAERAAETHANAAGASAVRNPWLLGVVGVLTAGVLGVAVWIGVQLVDEIKAVEIAPVRLSTLVCFLAMAFAILGFGLFVIGAVGSFFGNASGKGGSGSIETAAPGLVVIVCASLLIYFALDFAKPPTVSAATVTTKSTGSGSGSSQGSGVAAGSAAGSGAGSQERGPQ